MSNFTKSMFVRSVKELDGETAAGLDAEQPSEALSENEAKRPAKLDVERMTRAFVKMRDERARLKKEWEKQDGDIAAKQEVIEAAMLNFLNSHKLDSAPTEAGTFYKEEVLTPTGADWEVFYKWVKDNDAFDFLERRIKRTSVKDYMEDHAGVVPPGVSVFKEYVVRVRRK